MLLPREMHSLSRHELRSIVHVRSYRFSELMRFFNARRSTYHTNPRIIDEVIYTSYVYDPTSSRHVHFNHSRSSDESSQTQVPTQTGDLLGVPELVAGESSNPNAEIQISDVGPLNGAQRHKKKSKFEEVPTVAEIFMFEYGTVVIWGMTEAEEKRFLSSMCAFVNLHNLLAMLISRAANASKLRNYV